MSCLTGDAGKRTAVVLELWRHGRIWQDVCDQLLVEFRRDEPRESLDSVGKRLVRRPAKSDG